MAWRLPGSSQPNTAAGPCSSSEMKISVARATVAALNDTRNNRPTAAAIANCRGLLMMKGRSLEHPRPG